MYSIETQTRVLRKTHMNLVVVGGWNMAQSLGGAKSKAYDINDCAH